MSTNPLTVRLTELVEGFWGTQVIHAAVQLQLPDLIGSQPMLPEELARQVNVDAGGVMRLLRAMVTLGLCTSLPDGRFSLTELGALLRTDAVGGKRARAMFAGSSLYRTFEKLPEIIRTGRRPPATEDFASQTPEQLAIFQQAMIESSREAMSAAVAVYDFSTIERMLDVGGGFGGALAYLLERFTSLSGDVLDLPHAQGGAEAFLSRVGVRERAGFLPGDFFKNVPAGYGCYLLKFILHDWDDDKAIEILRTCSRAMSPTATLVVIERVIGPPNQIPEAKFSDLNMLVSHGALERTREEFDDLFAKGGFRLDRVIPTRSPLSVIVGRVRTS